MSPSIKSGVVLIHYSYYCWYVVIGKPTGWHTLKYIGIYGSCDMQTWHLLHLSKNSPELTHISKEQKKVCSQGQWWQQKNQCKYIKSPPVTLNSLRAKFFRGNINMYLHFKSFLHTDMPKIIEILPRISRSWLLMSWWRKEPGHQQPWYSPS